MRVWKNWPARSCRFKPKFSEGKINRQGTKNAKWEAEEPRNHGCTRIDTDEDHTEARALDAQDFQIAHTCRADRDLPVWRIG